MPSHASLDGRDRAVSFEDFGTAEAIAVKDEKTIARHCDHRS
jgi:hypothetical protein